MPIIAITQSDADNIFAYLGDRLQQRQQQLDATLKMALKAPPMATKTPPNPQALTYIWKSLMRDGKCVHCHAGKTEAASLFRANEVGLIEYVSKNDPWEIWRRLQTRAIEEEHGLNATKAGMPLGQAPLPESLRDLVARWIASGCLRPTGEMKCAKIGE